MKTHSKFQITNSKSRIPKSFEFVIHRRNYLCKPAITVDDIVDYSIMREIEKDGFIDERKLE